MPDMTATEARMRMNALRGRLKPKVGNDYAQFQRDNADVLNEINAVRGQATAYSTGLNREATQIRRDSGVEPSPPPDAGYVNKVREWSDAQYQQAMAAKASAPSYIDKANAMAAPFHEAKQAAAMGVTPDDYNRMAAMRSAPSEGMAPFIAGDRQRAMVDADTRAIRSVSGQTPLDQPLPSLDEIRARAMRKPTLGPAPVPDGYAQRHLDVTNPDSIKASGTPEVAARSNYNRALRAMDDREAGKANAYRAQVMQEGQAEREDAKKRALRSADLEMQLKEAQVAQALGKPPPGTAASREYDRTQRVGPEAVERANDAKANIADALGTAHALIGRPDWEVVTGALGVIDALPTQDAADVARGLLADLRAKGITEDGGWWVGPDAAGQHEAYRKVFSHLKILAGESYGPEEKPAPRVVRPPQASTGSGPENIGDTRSVGGRR